MSYTSNISLVINTVLDRLQGKAELADKVARSAALAVLPELKSRVHKQGLDSEGNAIGTYSKAYMKVRTGNFADAARHKRGALAGQHKAKKKKGEAGIHRQGPDKGKARPVYNRTADTKVIGSLTRQMENDISVIAGSRGEYAIGYNNRHNFDKSQWLEDTYNKKIWRLTTAERTLVVKTAEDVTKRYLNATP